MRRTLISAVLILSSISISFAKHEWSYEGKKEFIKYHDGYLKRF